MVPTSLHNMKNVARGGKYTDIPSLSYRKISKFSIIPKCLVQYDYRTEKFQYDNGNKILEGTVYRYTKKHTDIYRYTKYIDIPKISIYLIFSVYRNMVHTPYHYKKNKKYYYFFNLIRISEF